MAFVVDAGRMTGIGVLRSSRGHRQICATPVRMVQDGGDDAPKPAEFKGFGEPPSKRPKKEKTKASIEREEAGRKLDQMRQAGMPEYTIWLRQQGEEDWFPVGSMTVDRSSKIAKAIYDNEEALWRGARRQYPQLVGKEAETEIGYKLAEFPDEEVRIAERPSEDDGLLKKFFDRLLNPLNTGDD